MKIGYARVSTRDQSLETQESLLRDAGCGRIFSESVTGMRASRPEWDRALAAIRPGDELVVVRLDRAGRSLRNLIDVIDDLTAREASLTAIEQGLSTSTSTGRMLASMLGIVAEFERALISERTAEALAARPSASRGGRPKALSERAKARAQDLYDGGHMTVREIAAATGVSPATIYRSLNLGRQSPNSGGVRRP